jgi:ribonucleoside-diphosphate reductase alpha chain
MQNLLREIPEEVKNTLTAAFHGNGLSQLVNGEIKKIKKRDGREVDFDIKKIANVAYKAMLASGEGTEKDAIDVAKKVYLELLKNSAKQKNYTPHVEEVQDLVEKHLIFANLAQTAKAFILYRRERADLREKGLAVPEEVRELFKESKKYFRSPLAELVYYRSYSRWLEEEGRRETWVETIDRFMAFMKEGLKKALSEKEYKELRENILNQSIIPSMRLLWAAGSAAKATNVAAYNCSYVAPTCFRDFGEILYIQMCGVGVGFSVESQTVQTLPQIKKQTGKMLKTYVIDDSKEGWANSLVFGLETWANGNDVKFDYSKIRPSGARLKTMGGRASGPGPLKELLDFAREKILSRQGRRLTNIDVHDIICKSGEIVVAGGVRRSSLISLSDLDDNEMRFAKTGQFYLTHPHRSMANNSAVYNQKPTTSEFIDEWTALVKSGTGERGIFNRGSLVKQLPERRLKDIDGYLDTLGVNPCGEIILRSKQFCNLTGVVVRPEDTKKTLLEKVRLATILGTYQATLTYFPYLSKEWKKNCEEEALLGVSLTGYWDNKTIRNAKVLRALREKAIAVNKKYAKRFKINPSASVTCVKPSGNSSLLLDTASGMHPRFSKYYIRRIRINTTDPLLKMLKDQGVPAYPEVGQTVDTATTFVLEFPVKSPEGAIVKDDISALELLEHWKLLKENFTEHNPSATIYVSENEWIAVANWVYENWDIVGGLSFLPRNNHVYKLAPYEEIDEETYNKLSGIYENIDFSKLYLYEKKDETEGAKEYACTSGACEI